MTVGLGSDVAAGPEVSIFTVMRAGAVTQRVLELTGRGHPDGPMPAARLAPPRDARRRARARPGGTIGSLEPGHEADLIAIDPRLTSPLPSDDPPEPAEDLASRLVFRPHPNMVRGCMGARALARRTTGSSGDRLG